MASSSVPQEWLAIINEFGGEIPETSGVPVAEIQEGIKNGVRKVNIDTDLRLGVDRRRSTLLSLSNKGGVRSAQSIWRLSTKAMKELVVARYEAFGAAGQGAKIRPISSGKDGRAICLWRAGPAPVVTLGDGAHRSD